MVSDVPAALSGTHSILAGLLVSPAEPCLPPARNIPPSGFSRLDQRATWWGWGPATDTRCHRSLISGVTRSPAHTAGSETGDATMHHAMGIHVSLVRFSSRRLGTSMSKEHRGPADATSACTSLIHCTGLPCPFGEGLM